MRASPRRRSPPAVPLLGGLFLALSGCALPAEWLKQGPEATDPSAAAKVVYRMDLAMEVNGAKGLGVLVVPEAARYRMKFRADQDPELATIKNTHREIPLKKQDSEFELEVATNEVELGGADNSFEVRVFARKLWYQGGLILVRPPSYQAPATLFCNGVTSQEVGVAGCQARAGSVQRLRFSQQVRAGKPAICPPARPLEAGAIGPQSIPAQDGLAFELRPPADQCGYEFRETAAPFRWFRLTTRGYEEYLIPR